jgi:hypothetical protein
MSPRCRPHVFACLAAGLRVPRSPTSAWRSGPASYSPRARASARKVGHLTLASGS